MLLRLLRTHVRPYRRAVALLILLQLVQILGTLLLPTLGAALIDNGVVARDNGYIARLGGLMVAVAFVQVLAAVGAVSLAARTAMAMGRDIRSVVFRRVLDFSAREVGRFGTPSLLTRTVNDVQQVQTLAQSAFGIVVAAPLMCLGSVVLALRQDVPLALILVLLVLVVGVAFGLLLARMGALYARMQTGLDRLGRMLREQITGVRVVRSFVRDGYERERFARTSTELFEVSQRVGRLIASMLPVVLLLMNAFTVAILWAGAHRIDGGASAHRRAQRVPDVSLTGPDVGRDGRVRVPLGAPRAGVRRAHPGGRGDVVERRPAVPAGACRAGRGGPCRAARRGVPLPGRRKAGAPEDRSERRPGENVAILGSTGSGKTTLLNLVLRLFDATEGSVRVNGVDVRELDSEDLGRTVGFVPQRPYLFSGTVATNLRFGDPDATDDELWRVLRIAQANTFVANMPDGLDTEISQGGTNVSGGQRQRIAIARTLLRRPASTSSTTASPRSTTPRTPRCGPP